MTFNNSSPVALANEIRHGGKTVVLSMTNRDIPMLADGGRIPRDTFLIRRIISLVEDTLFEIVAIRNFDSREHSLQIEQWAGTRCDDLFEVRGFPRERRGRMLAPEEHQSGDLIRTTLQYLGLDQVLRRVHIQRYFVAEKIRLSPDRAGYFSRITIPPKGDVELRTIVSFDQVHSGKIAGQQFSGLSVPDMMKTLAGQIESSPFATGLRIETDNAIINRALENARTDIQMLLTLEDNLLYPYAGIPWFSAPFGRDGIITAYQTLPWYPALAKGVLHYAFKSLGTRFDEFTDEQPGKVFHEMRRGEMARTREVPFAPYYGSVDSTPLALILLHEYVSWTHDLASLKEWWPSALRALEWIRKWGDIDGDGFLEYAKQSPTGLVNQGWKDSHDSIMHEDGTWANAPIRLCEVQGYAFRARMGMSEMARLLGQKELASKLRLEALQLRSRFIEHFWDSKRKFIHLALDAERKPCSVLSSNMGHCLWSHILHPEHAVHVTRHLISNAMFSGYGVRTLADTEIAYNPLSYHNGSIWPHDNSLILEGFRFYDQREALETLALALIGVLESSTDFRLPELFCGFRRRGAEPPVPYEVACKPQAWAAGSVFLLIKSMLGISMDSDKSNLLFRAPLLTTKINTLQIQGLRARDWEIDLLVRQGRSGTHIDVARKSGSVRVLTVR